MGKWRVLVVDDDQDIRDLVRSSLEPGYEVVEARDGLDALEKLDRAEPDFVVLDIMMPLMDGIQTCEAIRRSRKYRDITVLFLSALAGQQDIRRGYDAGANLYLTKPFDPARLKRNIDVFFEKKAAQPQKPKTFTLHELEELESGGPEVISRSQPVAAVNVAERAPVPAAPAAASPASLLKPRILVVDDEPGICALAMQALHEKFEVFCAADGMDAISKITSYQPDLILIDTMMPRMSGYQLCQSLRHNARFAHTPIILASAKHSQKDRDYSMKIGANYFLQKPYTAIEVAHAAMEMTHRPDFRVHLKALTEQNIRDLESRHGEKKEEKNHEHVHREHMHDLQDFVPLHNSDYKNMPTQNSSS
jgi:DNA-binding response OmpR family regulator